MGGQKETHDEEAIANKLKTNGEASIFFLYFFSLKMETLPYSCWIQHMHDFVSE